MDKSKQNEEKEILPEQEEVNMENATKLQEETSISSEESSETDNVAESDTLLKKYDDLNDSHLRLMAEFDNYRKRTLREKAELIKSGGEAILTDLLPVIDDFERALQTIRVVDNVPTLIEGVELIYSKFMAFLARQGVKPIEAIGKPFDTEMFEAVATIPAPDESLKGKIVDCVQTGYILNDKVIRHAKVVVGE